MNAHRIEDIDRAVEAILELLELRASGTTICPSEAARLLATDGDFRPHMAVVRDAARILVADGRVEVLQKGDVIDLDGARGPIRLRMVRSAGGREER